MRGDLQSDAGMHPFIRAFIPYENGETRELDSHLNQKPVLRRSSGELDVPGAPKSEEI